MRQLLIAAFVSLTSGVVSHLLFFPITQNWHNNRMRRLSRYAIGIVTNLFSCVVWLRLLRIAPGDCIDPDDYHDRQSLLDGVAYLVSFLWTGIGVVIGYVLSDKMGELR